MEFTIRPVRPEDAEQICSFRKMPGVIENILALPDERTDYVSQFIGGLGEHGHQFVAVVKVDGQERVVGLSVLQVGTGRMRHSGVIAIMVHGEYQGQGIGKALMGAVINLADQWLMLVRLELIVYQDNQKAMKLYEQFGFEIEGTRKMGSIRNGEYADEYSMVRINPNMCLTK